MQIFYGDVDKLNTRTAVALGRFDAMHTGHIKTIGTAVEYANKNNMKSLVYMFVNNPIEVVTGRKIPSVNSLGKRMEILEECGVDIAVAKEFDKEIMNMSCGDFVGNVLYKSFNAAFVTAGYNYSFGRNGEGNIETLGELCSAYGIKVCEIPEVKVGGREVSSTGIRDLITSGNVAEAAELLGRFYSVSGEVVRGNGIGGKLLGFPTANIALPSDCVLPPFGVYITKTYIGGLEYKSITNIGGKPTVERGVQLIETHIDGEFGDLYGNKITVEFCKLLREIKRFDSIDELAEQLGRDKACMEKYFKK